MHKQRDHTYSCRVQLGNTWKEKQTGMSEYSLLLQQSACLTQTYGDCCHVWVPFSHQCKQQIHVTELLSSVGHQEMPFPVPPHCKLAPNYKVSLVSGNTEDIVELEWTCSTTCSSPAVWAQKRHCTTTQLPQQPGASTARLAWSPVTSQKLIWGPGLTSHPRPVFRTSSPSSLPRLRWFTCLFTDYETVVKFQPESIGVTWQLTWAGGIPCVWHSFTRYRETVMCLAKLGPPYPSMPHRGPQEFLTIQ